MDTLAWVSISDTNYILSLARSYFKLFIRGHSYLCHCQNSSKGPVTLMVGLLEAKGSAVTQIGSAALSAGERKASCTSFLSPLATASCQQKLLPSQGWKGRDVHLQSWGWTSFVWGGSCQSKERSCAFKIIFGLFHVILDKRMHRPSVLTKSFHLKFQTTVFAVLGHMFPSMTACREEICGELLLTDVANPPVKVKIRVMVLLLHQLQLSAKSLFQQQALNQPRVLETAKQADIFKDFFFFF